LYWHVLEEGRFKAIIEHEQRMVLLNRAREDGNPKSTTDSPLDEGDRMDSPTSTFYVMLADSAFELMTRSTLAQVSDEPFLCHTKGASEDASMPSGRLSKLSLREPLKRVLWSPTKRWQHRLSSSCSDNSALSLSTAATSADLHFTPVTPIDGPASPVSVALHRDDLPGLDISSPGLQYPLSSK